MTETIEYKGYEIEIIADETDENPFEAWDGNPPLAVSSGFSAPTQSNQRMTVIGELSNI